MLYEVDRDGNPIHGGFNCEQTFPTVFFNEDDPKVLAMLAKARAENPPPPTLEDIIAVLTPQQKTALQARLDARKL